jgi:hypothetical protein
MKKSTLWTLLAALAVPLPALAQEAAAPAATTAPGTQSLVAVVEAVQGNVRVRLSPDQPWVPATVGMELREGSSIRTGLKSAIRCSIGEEQMFVLDRLGVIELTEAVREGNLVKTDLTMKYGRAQYEVQRAGLEHDARITSPGATLAVRGTIGELENMAPFPARAVSYTGKVSFQAARKQTVLTGVGNDKVALSAGEQSVASAALLASVIDPQDAGSRTPADARFIAQQTSLGATARFDSATQITVITGGPGPVRTESDLVKSLPGRLNFVARWTGNANLNLQVGVSYGDPATTVLTTGEFNFSEFIYPGFALNVSPTGGRTDFDHRGGPNGGQEIVYWKGNFPVATYAIGVIQVSGEPTPLTVNAFLDGQKVAMFDFVPTVPVSPEGAKSTSYTYQMSNDKIVTPLVFLPLAADNPINEIPDANNNAPADLGQADTSTERLNQQTVRPNRVVRSERSVAAKTDADPAAKGKKAPIRRVISVGPKPGSKK